MPNLTGYKQVFHGITSAVDTSAQVPVGSRAYDTSGGEWIYIRGTASTSNGTWVVYDLASDRTELLGRAGAFYGPVAILGTAVTATEFGWAQIHGVNRSASTDTIAARVQLYVDGTVGRVDDADAAGSAVVGAISLSADASNVATVFITYPFYGGAAID